MALRQRGAEAMEAPPGCCLRLRVCRVEARAEVPVVKVWGSLEEDHGSQQQAQPVYEELWRPQVGRLCLAEVGGQWLRCKVLLRRGADYHVFLLEQGGAVTSVGVSRLRQASAAYFCPLPPHQLACALSNLAPPDGYYWNNCALHYFFSLQNQEVIGQVKDFLFPPGLVLLDIHVVTQRMVKLGLAKALTDAEFTAMLGCGSSTQCLPLPALNDGRPRDPLHVASMDYYYPRLQSGVAEPVTITQVSSPHSIFCQLSSMSQEVQILAQSMRHFYDTQAEDATFQKPLELGQPYASRGANGHWYRSLLEEFFLGNQQAMVIHVDWGYREVVTLNCLRRLAVEFFRMPVITFRCALYGVSNGGMAWERPMIDDLRSLLQGKPVSARIEFFNSFEHLYMVTLLDADGANLNYIFAARVQNLKKSLSDTSAAPPVTQSSLCLIENGDKITTPKLPKENYLPKFPRVELKTGTFYDAVVAFVLDPSNFWIQTTENALKHKEMVELITSTYSSASKLEGVVTKPKPGLICCARYKDGTYYRAEIVSVEKNQVKVYFVDYGNTELVDWYNVKELPEEFKGLPALANKCCLVDIYPLGETWSSEAILAFKVAVVDQKLVVYVISKNVEKYTIEVLVQSRIAEKNISKILSSEGHAKYEELETAVQMENGGGRRAVPSPPVSIPETGQHGITVEPSQDDFIHFSPYEDQLFEPGVTVEVVVSYIESPGLFWCQNAEQISTLNNLMDLIQAHCYSTDKAPESNALACLAKSPADGRWYRGFITEIQERPDHVEVLYVDYGKKETVPAENMRAMESDFFHLKSQAFKCSLYNLIAPVGDNPFCWDSKATKAFLNFAQKASKGSEFHCTFFAMALLDKEFFNIVDLHTPFDSVCNDLVKRGFATELSHKTLAPSVQLQSFYYSMHDIKMGSEEEVLIMYVSPSMEFYCQLSRNADTLKRISGAIEKACKKTQYLTLPCSGPLCLVKFTDGHWYRGFICSEDNGTEVFFVDFGNTEKVARDDLRPIMNSEHELLLLPMQAIKCCLADIPCSVPKEVGAWFEQTFLERTLRALVVAKEADGKLLVELYDGNEQVNVILKNKLGIHVPKAVQPSSQSFRFNQRETKNAYVCPGNGERKANGFNVPNNTNRSTVLQKQDQSCPWTQLPVERPADRYYNGKCQESSSQRRDAAPFQSHPKSALYQDRVANQDYSVRRKEVMALQNSERHSYQERLSNKNSKASFSKPFYQRPSHGAGTQNHSTTKIDDIPLWKITPGTKLPVYVSYGTTIFDFHVQTTESGLLDQITDALNGDRSTFEVLSENDVNVGDVICALYAADNLYYRGVVKQKTSSGLHVQYMDYGNTSVISNCKIYRLPQNLCSIPAQCIHCSFISSSRASSVCRAKEIWEIVFERVDAQTLNCEFVKLKDGKWDVVLYDEQGCINDLLLPPCGDNSPEAWQSKVTTEQKTRPEHMDVIRSFTWNLPQAGQIVQVYASAVDGPDYFWCQLSTTELDSLAKQIQDAGEKAIRDDYFIATLKVGSPCNVMYSEDNQWYRAVITKMEADVSTIRFVDYGNMKNTAKNQIRQLPDTLASLPTQAFPCRLAGFNVAAGMWTSEGKDYFYQQATEDVLELTVEDLQKDDLSKIPLAVVRLKYKELDLNEEMKRFWQPDQNESSSHEDLTSTKQDLTEGQLEEEQRVPEDLVWSISAVQDEADQVIATEDEPEVTDELVIEPECKKSLSKENDSEPSAEWQTTRENTIKSFTWQFPQTGESVKVFASFVDGPDHFWCQLSTTDLDSLARQTQDAGENSTRDDHFIATVEAGSPCNVVYSQDDNWYRALITEMEAEIVGVRFVDYGNKENAPKDQIRPLPDALAGLPTQAFPCRLAGFNVAAGTWTSEGKDYFYQQATEDVLELVVEAVQRDDLSKIPLALVRLKYNELDVNEEMKRFWQPVQDEYPEPREPPSIQEKPSIEEVLPEADDNMRLDGSPVDSSATDDFLEIKPSRDQGKGYEGYEGLNKKEYLANEENVGTRAHKGVLLEEVDTGDYECHGGRLVSESRSLEYEEDECEESTAYTDLIETTEPVEDIQHGQKNENPTANEVVLSNENEILQGEQPSAYQCEKQELVTSEYVKVEVVAAEEVTESKNEDTSYVSSVEAVVGEADDSEEAIMFVDSIETLDAGICDEAEAMTYMDEAMEAVFIEHEELKPVCFVDSAEPLSACDIGEHAEFEEVSYLDSVATIDFGAVELETITYMDCVEALAIDDVISYVDSVEVVTTGEDEKVEPITHVDSVEAVASGTVGESEEVEAITPMDSVEAIIIGSVGEFEEAEAITSLDSVEARTIGGIGESKDVEGVTALSGVEAMTPVDSEECVTIGDIGTFEEVEAVTPVDLVEAIITGNFSEFEEFEVRTLVDSVEAKTIVQFGEVEAMNPLGCVEAITIHDLGECVAAITIGNTGEFEEFETVTPVDSVEAVAVEAMTPVDGVEAVAVEAMTPVDGVEAVAVEAMTGVDGVEAVAVEAMTPVDGVEAVAVKAMTGVDGVEAVAVEVMTSEDCEEARTIRDTGEYVDIDITTAVNSVEAVTICDLGECIDVEVTTPVDCVEAITIGEFEQFEAMTAVDSVEAVAVEAVTPVDSVEAVTVEVMLSEDREEVRTIRHVGECVDIEVTTTVNNVEAVAVEAMTPVDSVEAVAIGECEEVEAVTPVDSEETLVGDIDKGDDLDALTSEDIVEAVDVCVTGHSGNTGACVFSTAVVSSKDIEGPEDSITSDKCLQDAAAGKRIVEHGGTIEAGGLLHSEDPVVSSDVESEEVLLREDVIGTTELVEYGPSEDLKEPEEPWDSQDVDESVEGKHREQVGESENAAVTGDLVENTASENVGDVALLCSGRQSLERELTRVSDIPEEAKRCHDSQDSHNAPSHTLADEVKRKTSISNLLFT